MLLPDQVVVYGDCAVNPDPNAAELAEIALQTAASASAFGIEPRVAMISYSTGDSGTGSEVEKVREATRLARMRRPELLIDGPLQYDAAAIASVGKQKAPNSPVAGHATVFVFPDLPGPARIRPARGCPPAACAAHAPHCRRIRAAPAHRPRPVPSAN